MAKKQAAKKKGKQQSVPLRFISDPGHGWLEVPEALCKKLGLGTDFPNRKGFCYLEEDAECTDFDRAAKRHGLSFVTPEHEVDSFDQWLSGKQWPYIPAWIYGEDIRLVMRALLAYPLNLKRCTELALMFATMQGEVINASTPE